VIQKDINNAPKANESLLYGVGYKPFAVGVLYFIIMKKHGDCTHTSATKLYYVWRSMKRRILFNKDPKYKYYGGKGIKLCNEWLDYINFRTWANNNGYKEGLTLDRIDNEYDYCPENCRWTTYSNNMYNKTRKKNFGLNYHTKYKRYYIMIWRNHQFYYNSSSKDINVAYKLRDDLLRKLDNEFPFK
jgi:hypothetical protein